MWRQANKYKVPRIAFINKIDRTGADFYQVMDEIKDKLKANTIAIQIPYGSESNFKGVIDLINMKLIIWEDKLGLNFETYDIPDDMIEISNEYRDLMLEKLAEKDDIILEKFFDDKDSITTDEIDNALRKLTLNSECTPILVGSALKNKGIQPLLDSIIKYLPEPKQDTNNLVALAFKVSTDKYDNRIVYLRVYSGSIKLGDVIYNPRTKQKERIMRLSEMHANKQISKKIIKAGEICTVVGLKTTKTGDTLCDKNNPILLESMVFPKPVIRLAIEPTTQSDIEKLEYALNLFEDEDPTFITKEENGQTIISGMGELHLEILIERLKLEHNVKVNKGIPIVAYRETYINQITHNEIFERKIGDAVKQSTYFKNNKFAEITFQIGPSKNDGLTFINESELPKEYVNSVEKGFNMCMLNGALGYPVDNLKVTLLSGNYNSDSDEISFETVANIGFRNSTKKINPTILEPIMKVEIVTPDKYMGEILSDLNRKNGQIQSIDKSIKIIVPLSNLFGYETKLRSLSSGRASSSIQFSHYDIKI